MADKLMNIPNDDRVDRTVDLPYVQIVYLHLLFYFYEEREFKLLNFFILVVMNINLLPIALSHKIKVFIHLLFENCKPVFFQLLSNTQTNFKNSYIVPFVATPLKVRFVVFLKKAFIGYFQLGQVILGQVIVPHGQEI